MNDHDKAIEVIAAHRDGKNLQWWREYDKTWVDLETCSAERLLWTMASTAVRVKPEPRRLYVPNTGPVGRCGVLAYPTRADAAVIWHDREISEFAEVVR